MKADDYQKYIIESYLKALSALVMEFRSVGRGDNEKQEKLVSAYNAILDLLLSTGWNSWLDPDCELPDEFILPRYFLRNDGAND